MVHFSKRNIVILLLFFSILSLSSMLRYIHKADTKPVYSPNGVQNLLALPEWIGAGLGLPSRNLTAELIPEGCTRWRQLLEEEKTSSHVYESKEILQYHGFDGRFDKADRVEPGPYLRNYANPCWYEEMPQIASNETLYENNCLMKKGNLFTRLTYKTYMLSMARMTEQEEYMTSLKRSWRLRCIPNVYLIGADKCGTSALTLYIQDHPLMAKGVFKEIRYWTNFINTCLSPISDYADMYDKASEKIRSRIIEPSGDTPLPYHPALALDPTPSTYKQYVCQGYAKYHKACSGERLSVAYILKKLVPDAKILAMVRNPVDRVYSSYYFTSLRHDNRTVDEKTFDEDVEEFLELYRACVQKNPVERCASGRGFGPNLTDQQRTVFLGAVYSVHFRHFVKAFGKENMKVVTLEDFASDPRAVRDQIFAFLNMPGTHRFYDRGVVNAGPSKLPMMMRTRSKLNAFFKPFNEEFEQMFGISYDF